jgi:hypothetical protein
VLKAIIEWPITVKPFPLKVLIVPKYANYYPVTMEAALQNFNLTGYFLQ